MTFRMKEMELLGLKPEVSDDAEYLSGHNLSASCKDAVLGREGIKIFPFLLFIIFALSFIPPEAIANPNPRQSDNQDSNIETYLGNKGYLYSNSEVPQIMPKNKETYRPKKQPSKKAKTEEFLYENPPEIPTEETKITTPEEEIALLKKKLDIALNRLASANKKIEQLQRDKLYSKATQTYHVKKGDSLWKIAAKKEIYNNPYKWLLLYHANRDQIYDPGLIYPYMILTVPRFEEYEKRAK